MFSTIQSHPRDYCLHRHVSFDEDLNCYFIMFSSTTYPSCKPSPSIVRGEMSNTLSWNWLIVDVGYRIEEVKSGVSRVTMVYSIQPRGFLGSSSYLSTYYEELFVQSLPGLRDMLSQIPEYHIFNLIERIVKGSEQSLSRSISIEGGIIVIKTHSLTHSFTHSLFQTHSLFHSFTL